MERTVPSTASEEVELYLRTYYSLLRSSSEVQIKTLEEVHAGMHSLLHPNARDLYPDLSAFIYCLLRLPASIQQVDLVVLGQSPRVFQRRGIGDVEAWENVSSPARRRRCYFDGTATLACFIASRSDIDDLIPTLTAYQIEWNKVHNLFIQMNTSTQISSLKEWSHIYSLDKIAAILNIPIDDLQRLQTFWGEGFYPNLYQIVQHRKYIRVQLLSGSLSDYRRATHNWWENIEEKYPEILELPVYFISSNIHSVVNLISGFAQQKKNELISFLESSEDNLQEEWKGIQTKEINASQENLLYYLLKKYQSTPNGQSSVDEQLRYEREHGIIRISSEHSFDVDAQIIELHHFNNNRLDSRLGSFDKDILATSDALILNIDYPLGLAAYNILSELSTHVRYLMGVYIMGKAASLNGVLGDIIIPNVVHDEHSQNTYLFSNCFKADDVSPYLLFGTGMDNQKSVSVRGTFLQNARYMDVFYREGYTDIEMEAGSYLSAVYEMYRPKRHPDNEIVNLYGLPFDLGIIHYISDTPMSKGRNLGTGNLSYYGMDSTYAASIAILRRIISLEIERLKRI